MAVKFFLGNYQFSAYYKLSKLTFSKKANIVFSKKVRSNAYVYHCSQVLSLTKGYFCYSGF